MSSLLNLKRDNFRKNIRRCAHERIFKIKRIPEITEQEMRTLILQKDVDSINKLCDATAGNKEQIQFLINIGGVQYFYDILLNQQQNKESAIIGLGNLCQEKNILEDVYDQNLVEFLLEEVHKYKSIDQLVLRLWILGILSKFDSDNINYEELDQQRSKIFSVFITYQQKYKDIIQIQEECFYGFYQLSKVTYFQNDLMKLCCQNLNKGYDGSIISTIYYLLNDNIQFITELHESQFIEYCHLHLQIKSRQKHVLQILYYYSQYYVEDLVNNNRIVEQILLIQNSQQFEQEIVLLHYSMLFYSPTALVMKIIQEFKIIEFIKQILQEFQYEQKILCLIALLQQIKQELITELIPLLEKIMFEKNISLSTTKKIKLLIG